MMATYRRSAGSGLLAIWSGLGWIGERDDANMWEMAWIGLFGTVAIALILLLALPVWVLLARFHRRRWWVAALSGAAPPFVPIAWVSALAILQ
jgi:hypothetical protein